jgi:hypothetical protein
LDGGVIEFRSRLAAVVRSTASATFSPGPSCAESRQAAKISSGYYGKPVEDARLKEPAHNLFLQTDAKRNHTGQRRDSNRNTQRGESGAQERLPQIPHRKTHGVAEIHDKDSV